MPTQSLTERADILGIIVKGLPIFIAFLIGATGTLFIGILGPVAIAVLWLVAIVLGFLVLYVQSRRRRIEMYTEIANGLAPHNWWPGDVGPSNHRYDEWSEQIERLISYESRVQKDMRTDYTRLVPFLKGPHDMSQRNEANETLREVQRKAREKLARLRWQRKVS